MPIVKHQTDLPPFDWKKHIYEALSATNYCCLATVDDRGVWSNPVYFAWDDHYHIYFISQMSSRHMQNLMKHNRVALSIYKTEQKGDVVGIQLEGNALIVGHDADPAEIQRAHDTYYGRAGFGPDVQEYRNNPSWLYVKVSPEQVYYFDTRFFGEVRQEVPMHKLVHPFPDS